MHDCRYIHEKYEQLRVTTVQFMQDTLSLPLRNEHTGVYIPRWLPA